MKRTISLIGAAMLLTRAVHAAAISAEPTNAFPVDLLTVLRLSGAQNLDVQIARERLAEAQANYGSAVAQLFPTLSPGVTSRSRRIRRALLRRSV